ncbi:MAG: ABC transporter permease, partial [Cardiobacterium hominis]
MTRNLLTLIGKELRSLLADPILILLIAYMFTGMVIAMSQSNTDIRNAAVAIIDEDRSPFSRRLADAIRPPYFRAPVAIERDQADAAMNRGDYVFILEIPANFERDLLQNHAPEILLNIDATRMSQGGIGSAYLGQIFTREIRETLNTPSAAPPVQPIIRTRYNPNAENAY